MSSMEARHHPFFKDASAEFRQQLVTEYDMQKAKHREALQKALSMLDIRFDNHPNLTAAIRFNMMQLYMAVGKDGKTSIGAKGQTGEGYEGHVFWDADTFVLPVFAYCQPEIARKMILYRHGMLGAARDIARTMGHKSGALFPWRTITGPECSSFFPAGSAQYHINADIAFAIKQYVEATGDTELLRSHGLELLVESARIWPQVGFFNARKAGKFCINCVTGPDEYSAIVDNNLYTNLMAKAHLEFTIESLGTLKKRGPVPSPGNMRAAEYHR